MDEPDDYDAPPYAMPLQCGDWSRREPTRMSVKPLWQGLIDDLRKGVSPARISSRFHASIAYNFVQAAMNTRAATGIEQVALSGGCMHNRRLARLIRIGLEEAGFHVFQHRAVSPGDGGLSYGQAAVAAAILRGVKSPGLGAGTHDNQEHYLVNPDGSRLHPERTHHARWHLHRHESRSPPGFRCSRAHIACCRFCAFPCLLFCAARAEPLCLQSWRASFWQHIPHSVGEPAQSLDTVAALCPLCSRYS